jgi:hypothetical protein
MSPAPGPAQKPGDSSSDFRSAVVKITPTMASKWLEKNIEHNRRVSVPKVQGYARNILENDWKLTGDSIKFSKDGKLIDGQHRLLAIVEAGAPMTSLVIENVEPEAIGVLDTGQTRSAAQALQIANLQVKNLTHIVASAQVVSAVERGKIVKSSDILGGQDRLSSIEIQKYVVEHLEEIDSAVKLAKTIPVTTLAIPASLVASAIILTRRVDEEWSNDFFDRIRQNKTNGIGDPVNTLIQRAALEKGKGRTIFAGMGLYMLMRTWNADRANENFQKMPTGTSGAPAYLPRLI